jgi:serine/threonine protein phosphatase 1
MRVLAIGDIHGCSVALRTLLAAVAPEPEDRIVTLGDYVDRGPDSRGVLDQLIALRGTGTLIPLRGNHEVMMLAARDGCDVPLWLTCGGRETLWSYGAPFPDPEELKRVPAEHWYFMEHDCRDWYETPTHFFVHASAEPDIPLDEQPDSALHWERFESAGPHCSGKIMVCGHTQQREGVPRNLGHAVCIDTSCYTGRWLTCLDVETAMYWQANEQGEVRKGVLATPRRRW